MMDFTPVFLSLVISSIMVAAMFLPAIKIGLNLADETYLHFGSASLLEGKTPIRDFRAYDPGRYYWGALWMRFLGPTYLSQRLAMGFIMVIALSIFCYWIFQIGQSWSVATLATLISFIWMRPYFKAFEILFSLGAVTVSYFIITDPGTATYLLSGFIVGIAVFFGLNIGLYTGFSVLLALAVRFAMQPAEAPVAALLYMMAGFAAGISPILLLSLKKPGYFSMYWEKKIMTVMRRGTSNLPLPLPWAWAYPPFLNNLSPTRRLFFKVIFTCLIPFYVSMLMLGLGFLGVHSLTGGLIISASLVGFVYLHHLFSRADVPHMWQTIHPGLMLLSILPATFLPWQWASLILVLIAALSAWAILPQWSVLLHFIRNSKTYRKYDTGLEILWLPNGQADLLESLSQIVDANSARDDAVFFAPTVPGLYRILGRRPALYDIYCIYPETPAKQLQMIQSLQDQHVSIVIIFDQAIDQNEKLMFSKTHSQVWLHLNRYFGLLETDHLPLAVKIFMKTASV